MKKVRKATRPFRYDLSQTSYDSGGEESTQLDLIECLKNYGRRFITLYRRQ